MFIANNCHNVCHWVLKFQMDPEYSRKKCCILGNIYLPRKSTLFSNHVGYTFFA